MFRTRARVCRIRLFAVTPLRSFTIDDKRRKQAEIDIHRLESLTIGAARYMSQKAPSAVVGGGGVVAPWPSASMAAKRPASSRWRTDIAFHAGDLTGNLRRILPWRSAIQETRAVQECVSMDPPGVRTRRLETRDSKNSCCSPCFNLV